MSILSSLSPTSGATHYRKRVGRGIGSGLGGYSGKGGKGQTQRSGGKIKRGFEGGQTPLHRRLPKFGFSNVDFEVKYTVLNISVLEKFDTSVTPDVLRSAGLVGKERIKVLGNGSLTKKLTVSAHAFSKAAIAAIEKAGGKVEVLK